jgi:putative SOS response-associated peptidase YedK
MYDWAPAFTLKGSRMCNLYSITTNQAAIIALFRVMNRYVGNLPPMSGVFPDYPAPVVRNAAGERESALANFRFGAHYGLKSDIASGPKCAQEQNTRTVP